LIECLNHHRFGILVALLELRFDKFDIPVAEFMPDKMVNSLSCLVESIIFQRIIQLLNNPGQTAANPAVRKSQRLLNNSRFFLAEIHQNKTGGIPDFIGKGPIASHSFFR